MDPALVQQLGGLLGLEQLVPSLDAHDTPGALRQHLQGLLGTSNDAQKLTARIEESRFGASTSAPAAPQPPAPQTASPAQNLFGFGGRVPVKEASSARRRAEASAAPMRKSLPATPEMRMVDAAVTLLTTERSLTGPVNVQICVCQARSHPVAPYAPMCTKCGLVLCTALRPPPVAPDAECPSCGTSPIVPPAARTHLLAELTETRERLTAEQEAAYEQERMERRLAAERGGSALFPALGQGAQSSTSAPARDEPKARVLHLDMKSHKVTAPKAKPRAPAPPKAAAGAGGPAELLTSAEDLRSLVQDYDDDGFRKRHTSDDAIPSRSAPLPWSALHDPAGEMPEYIPADARPDAVQPAVSEVITEVPELELLLQARPPGSDADSQRRQRNRAIAAGTARSQARKTGKPGKRR